MEDNFDDIIADKLKLNFEKKEEAIKAVHEEFLKMPKVDAQRLQGTFDIAKEVIDAFERGERNVIVNAPTGFGKSFLAFAVTEIIKKLEGQSYILVPNKFLQEQYSEDIEVKKLDMAMLKGQGNYTCSQNKKRIPERECVDEKINDVMNDKVRSFPCSSTCDYMDLRQKAIKSSTTVLNNQFWLLSMNKVLKMVGDNAPFKVRNCTVFDEAHTIGGIVQNQFTTKFDLNGFIRESMAVGKLIEFTERLDTEHPMSNIWSYVDVANAAIKLKNEYTYHKEFQMSSFDTVHEAFTQLLESISNVYTLVSGQIVKIFMELQTIYSGVPTHLLQKYANKDQKRILKYGNTVMTLVNEMSELKEFYELLGKKSITVAISELSTEEYAPIEEFGDISMNAFTFNCAHESGIVKKAVLEYTHYALWMSATFGSIEDWAKQTGIDTYYAIDVPQVFDYSRSPIYKVHPMISMNKNNKAANMDIMVSRIIDIVDSRPGRRGLIHTGNFQIMRAIQNQKHPRILCYSNSNEKDDILSLLKKRPDAIVCGPSLVEGVDLKDDLARFMILCKVPYQSLADELVKRKMLIYPNWYNWQTMSQIEQGLGRAVRNHNDWCETFLLDASFESFFNRYSPKQYVEDRLVESSVIEVLKGFDMPE